MKGLPSRAGPIFIAERFRPRHSRRPGALRRHRPHPGNTTAPAPHTPPRRCRERGRPGTSWTESPQAHCPAEVPGWYHRTGRSTSTSGISPGPIFLAVPAPKNPLHCPQTLPAPGAPRRRGGRAPRPAGGPGRPGRPVAPAGGRRRPRRAPRGPWPPGRTQKSTLTFLRVTGPMPI